VIRAQLIDSATGRVLGTKTFHALTPAATEDPYGGVKAMSQSLRRVLDEIVVFCVGAARDAGALTP
jgi:cholesterol transport system auxiliary component